MTSLFYQIILLLCMAIPILSCQKSAIVETTPVGVHRASDEREPVIKEIIVPQEVLDRIEREEKKGKPPRLQDFEAPPPG